MFYSTVLRFSERCLAIACIKNVNFFIISWIFCFEKYNNPYLRNITFTYLDSGFFNSSIPFSAYLFIYSYWRSVFLKSFFKLFGCLWKNFLFPKVKPSKIVDNGIVNQHKASKKLLLPCFICHELLIQWFLNKLLADKKLT